MKWLIFFLVLPHLKPPSFEYLWPGLEQTFNIARIFSAVVVIFFYILKKKIPSPPIWVIASLEGLILISTYINGIELTGIMLKIVSIVCISALVDLFANYPQALVQGTMLNLEWCIYLNLFSILRTFPKGLYVRETYSGACYFLGYHNGFFEYVLLTAFVSLLYWKIENKRIRPICLSIAGCACILITWSATSVVALMIIVVVLVLSHSKLRNQITYPTVFFITMSANLLISVFRVMDRVMLVAWWIETILKKQITLTGRTYLWDECYRLMREHPFRGYGTGAHIRRYSIIYSAHNEYFELIIEGGIFALILFLLFNALIGKKLIRYRNSRVADICLAILAGLYTIFIAEAYLTPLVFMLLIMIYHIDKFDACLETSMHSSQYIKRGHHVPNRKLTEKH